MYLPDAYFYILAVITYGTYIPEEQFSNFHMLSCRITVIIGNHIPKFLYSPWREYNGPLLNIVLLLLLV